MEIGNEISKKIRDAIKSKLQELGSYVDDELPDYIMVMLANKRNESQMAEDLMLFLGENTIKFTDWLYRLLEKLQQVTTLQDNEEATQREEQPAEKVPPQTAAVISPLQSKKERSPSPVKATKTRKRSPAREPTHESKSRRHSSEKQERSRITSTVGKASSSSRSSSRRRRTSSDDEDSSKGVSSMSSVVKVKEKRPTLAPARQATSTLLKKAVAEAHMSVHQLANSSSYDPTSPPQPIRTNSYAEKQHQKELLLQQHRELVRQQQEEVEEKKGNEEQEVRQEREDATPKETQTTSTTKVEVEEPVIELRVSEAEALEYSIEDKGDTRVVAFADSQAGGEDSEEEKRRRRRKRRAVKSKERASSPKFIVTLDGVGSDLEDKYDVTEREERHKKLKKELDDFEEVDTTEGVQRTPIPPPVVEQVQLRLGTAAQPEDDLNGSQGPPQPQHEERCKFWPDCKHGDSCLYYHPTVPCRAFPSCRFGDKCLFIHPVCKFDAGCTNPLCGFLHPSKNKAPTTPASAPFSGSPRPFAGSVSSPPVPCRFYPNCTKPNCQFYHPPKKACRFGAGCTRDGCVFSHPPKPSELKWVKPASHISERNFAVSLENVTPMPVK